MAKLSAIISKIARDSFNSIAGEIRDSDTRLILNAPNSKELMGRISSEAFGNDSLSSLVNSFDDPITQEDIIDAISKRHDGFSNFAEQICEYLSETQNTIREYEEAGINVSDFLSGAIRVLEGKVGSVLISEEKQEARQKNLFKYNLHALNTEEVKNALKEMGNYANRKGEKRDSIQKDFMGVISGYMRELYGGEETRRETYLRETPAPKKGLAKLVSKALTKTKLKKEIQGPINPGPMPEQPTDADLEPVRAFSNMVADLYRGKYDSDDSIHKTLIAVAYKGVRQDRGSLKYITDAVTAQPDMQAKSELIGRLYQSRNDYSEIKEVLQAPSTTN